MTGEKEQSEVEIGRKEKNEKETRKNRTEGKRQKHYLDLATIGDGPVEDYGRFLALALALVLLAQWRAGDYVEANGVGTGVTIAQEHLLDLKLYHKERSKETEKYLGTGDRLYLQAQAQVAQVDQGDGRAPEALLLQLLMCLQSLLLRLSPPPRGTTGHPVGPVLPVRQTGEDLLTQIGEVVLVPPLEVAGLEMLLIPETIESKYYTYEKREPLYGLNNVLRPDNIKMNYDNDFWNKHQKTRERIRERD